MDDDRGRDALALAEAALALADARRRRPRPRRSSSADDSALTRFANSEIHQNVAETNVAINLRVVVGKRVGVASSGRTDAEGLRRLAEQRDAPSPGSSRSSRTGAACPARPRSATSRRPTARRRPSASPGVPGRGRRAPSSAPRTTPGVTAYGSFATGLESIAVANSHGARAAGTRTTSQLITVSMGPDGGSGYAEAAAVDASTIDAAALGREAAGKARATANAVSVEPGDYPVVLEEYAVVDLAGHARLPRLLGARGPGGAQLRRARQADRQRPRDDRRRRLRPGRAAAAVRLRGRRQAAGRRSSRRASAATSCTTPRPRPAPASRRPATACRRRTRGGRSRSTWSWRPERRRATS